MEEAFFRNIMAGRCVFFLLFFSPFFPLHREAEIPPPPLSSFFPLTTFNLLN